MITKEDVKALVTYFQSLTSVPEELTKVVSKLECLDTINDAQASLIELSNEGE